MFKVPESDSWCISGYYFMYFLGEGVYIFKVGLIFFINFGYSPEGIETLCADMEVDHTDVRVLMLAW